MLDIRLYMAQRISALIMAPLVLGHIALMFYAVRGGLSADEILGRTQGSIWWMLFYGTFVAAVSIHAAIGLRVIAFETLKVRGALLSAFTWIVFLVLLYMGANAVYAVTMPGAST
jgi:fumarate reductase subunit C